MTRRGRKRIKIDKKALSILIFFIVKKTQKCYSLKMTYLQSLSDKILVITLDPKFTVIHFIHLLSKGNSPQIFSFINLSRTLLAFILTKRHRSIASKLT
jgi:hypothetical protein